MFNQYITVKSSHSNAIFGKFKCKAVELSPKYLTFDAVPALGLGALAGLETTPLGAFLGGIHLRRRQ